MAALLVLGTVLIALAADALLRLRRRVAVPAFLIGGIESVEAPGTRSYGSPDQRAPRRHAKPIVAAGRFRGAKGGEL